MKLHSKLSAVTSNGSIYMSYADPALDTDAIFYVTKKPKPV